MAEDYHQEYFANNGNQPYCQFVVAPKVKKFEQKFAQKVKARAQHFPLFRCCAKLFVFIAMTALLRANSRISRSVEGKTDARRTYETLSYIVVLHLLMAASLSTLAQEPAANPGGADKKAAKAEKKEAKAAAKRASTMSLDRLGQGYEDGKTVFINDKDRQAWNIENMDACAGAVKAHHVKVRAKLNEEADHSVNAEKLSMLRKEQADR